MKTKIATKMKTNGKKSRKETEKKNCRRKSIYKHTVRENGTDIKRQIKGEQ